ncbi:Oxysterol-binding protein-related protein 1 [Diaporthe amygdali]|uniref:Oxysterol-binding protein-related protein 1 n=1 Tax=Phomopsis amygdali TaxID=1214568 RepID=UPI0022FF351E|nr:Oxysterol-binding protein-related protein 1 [Diaporthe amygdali]KAJ0120271.1 Oxysterol-binding protein-related protein 1 [Diaporthe amygdali]
MGGYEAGDRMVPVRTSSESRLPGRSRTPWDAGGYSLPLTLNVKNAQSSPAAKPSFYTEATPVDSVGSTSPKSPKHKFSDSRSSLSSYTTMSSNTSSHSRSHSRISSLSTVSEYQPMNSFMSDSTPTERRMSDPDSGMSCPTVVEIQPPSPSRRAFEDVSPDASDNDSPMHSDRPRSPSDAILVRNRGLAGSASPSDSKIISSFLRPDSPSMSTSRAHKRTVSAPDFPSLQQRSHHYPSFGPMAEPTPPKSPTADEQQSVGSDTAMPTDPAENTQTASVLPRPTPPEPRCMFVDPCTTGSSLRKAISHIFGRNKLCTKAIPHGIWVHYCRKHYQRSRYRNATDYAIRQVELVLIQIEKVHAWSDENIKSGRRGDGVLKHWTLQARKREAKRLQESDSRKRRFNDDDDEDQEFSSGTAIPGWLQDKLNKDYGTEDMLAIIKDVKARMDAGEIQQIPDIEILPEIITDGNESRPKATVRRTGSNGNGHRHTKSEVYRAPPSMSSYNGRPGMSFSQDNKRFRTGASTYQMPIHNLAHRSLGGMNQGYPYQMGNGFAAIAENQADPNFWNPQPYSSNTVLPAPVPQRHVSMPMTPENNAVQSYAPQSRPLHVRSVSENPVLHNSGHGPTGFRPYASQPNQGFQQQEMFANYQPPQGYGGPPTYQGQGYDPNMGSNDPNTRFFGPMDGAFDGSADWDSPRNGHNRVQSTSSMHPAHMQRHLSLSGGPPPMSSLPSMNGMGNNGVPAYGYGEYQQHQQQHRY